MGLRSAIVTVLLFIPVSLLGQNVSIDQVRFKSVANIDQLPSYTVISQARDPYGFMWFGTFNGLVRYDGYQFKTYQSVPGDTTSLITNLAYSLLCTGKKYMWVGTMGSGLDKMNFRNDTFIHYQNRVDNAVRRLTDGINNLYRDKWGNLWVMTENGLGLLKKGARNIHYFYKGKNNKVAFYSFLVDSLNEVWIGSSRGLLYYRSEKEFLDKIKKGNWNFVHIKSPVWRIFEDRQEHIWFGTGNITDTGTGLYRYDLKNREWHHYYHQSGNKHSISSNRITSFCELFDGSLWIGTDHGLDYYQPKTDNFIQYIHSELNRYSIPFNYIDSIQFTDKNVMFITGHLKGICKAIVTQNTFERIKHEKGNSNSLSGNIFYSIYEDYNHNLWMGSVDYGVSEWKNNSHKFIHFMPGPVSSKSLGGSSVFSIIQDSSGTFWFGHYGKGVSRYNPKTGIFRHYYPGKSGLRSGRVEKLYIDREHRLWAGTLSSGLYIYVRSKDRFVPFEKLFKLNLSFKKIGVGAFYEDDNGFFWIGTVEHGLYRFNPKTGVMVHYFSNGDKKHWISNNFVYCIVKDHSGHLWVGTKRGLNLYHPKTKSFTIFSKSEQLPDLQINALVPDKHNNLWLTTNHNIVKISASRTKVYVYNVEEQFPQIEFTPLANCMTHNGMIYFGSTEGVVHFDPDKITGNQYVPPVVITSILVMNKPYKTFSPYKGIKELSIPYRDNLLTFDFAALDYHQPQKNQYAYKLDGLNNKWVYLKNRRYCSFTNLYPGRYVLHVKASNNDGVWNEKGTSLILDIEPPFWMTWWFILMMVSLCIIGLVLVVRHFTGRKLRQRMKQMEQNMLISEEREKTRAAIARDLHDEIASTLGSIVLYSDMVGQSNWTHEKTTQLLKKIGALSGEAIDKMNDIVWYVAPQHDTMNHLFMKIRNLVSNLSMSKDLNFRIDIQEPENDIAISEQVRRNTYLICKEAVHNILKHAHARNVQVAARYKNRRMQIFICDDGQGIAEEVLSVLAKDDFDMKNHPKLLTNHGLSNMQFRAKEMGAILRFRSFPGKGTILYCSMRIA